MVEPLKQVRSRAAVLPDQNIDTDVIFPARFLLLIDREGMDKCLFADRRLLPNGEENPDFPLNRDLYRDVKILVVGPGFGCGSSREQAVWALVDYGIRVVIGTDFGDIFAGNAKKNGLLLIRVDPGTHAQIISKAETGEFFEVDLPAGRVTVNGETVCTFQLTESELHAYINGWDEMDIILNTEMPHILEFEKTHMSRQPWLFSEAER